MEKHGMVERSRAIRRVLFYTFLMNEAVALAKITWGYLTGSLGMLSDGFHSLFDGLSNIVGIVGICIAYQPPDREHPYGHRKFETLFSIIVGLMIIGTCYQILKNVYFSIQEGYQTVVVPTSFVVMALTIAVNVFTMLYERKRGRELKSAFLIADALHTKSNVIASGAVVAGLVLTKAGYPMADALVGVVIAVFIAKIGIDVIKESSDVLVDRSFMDLEAIERVACSTEGVMGCHAVRARGPEGHVLVDLHIQLDPHMRLIEAHEITHRVQEKIKEAFPGVADIVVHTEPEKEKQTNG
jgi:cation diffusion facilitator family transporter